MKIWMIWATDGEVRWLISAWDDDSVSNNHSGWLDEIKMAQVDHGDNYRIITARIDFDAVDKAFAPADAGVLTEVEQIHE